MNGTCERCQVGCGEPRLTSPRRALRCASHLFFEAGVTNATFPPNVYESVERRHCVPLVVGMTLTVQAQSGRRDRRRAGLHRQGTRTMTADSPNTERLNAF